MSLTINRHIASNAGTWKRLKMQYVALACGAALALSAAIALGGWETSGSAPTSAPAATAWSAPRYSYESRPTPLVYYLAGSLEQVAQVDAAENQAALERDYANIMGPAGSITGLLVDTPENEALALAQIEAVAMDGAVANFVLEVIDMRVK
jgi:hypothetical protein